MVLILLGVLLSFGLPKLNNYQQSACDKKMQLQVFNFKLELKRQISLQNNIKNPTINWKMLYENLDMQPSSCYFEAQKNGFVGVNQNRKVYFVLKDNLLECEHTRSATLHNGESYCDIF